MGRSLELWAVAILAGVFGCGREPPRLPPVTQPVSRPSCTSVPWADDDNAAEATYQGKLTVVTTFDAFGRREQPFVLVLDEPACLPPEGTEKKTTEVQVFSGDPAVQARLASFVGKHVTVRGEAFTPHTGHHHRPIVVDAKSLE